MGDLSLFAAREAPASTPPNATIESRPKSRRLGFFRRIVAMEVILDLLSYHESGVAK
tara:strand:+ start:466 stop:636 length:171 start_codon:yes stop_codon:yes gene_type:complete